MTRSILPFRKSPSLPRPSSFSKASEFRMKMSSAAYSSHTGEYDRIKAIATKYYFSPDLPLSEFLSDVSLSNSDRVLTVLAKQGIISFKDLFQLPRTRWNDLRLDDESRRALRSQIIYLRHFNRFEQQSKKFYNFVLSPSTLFLLLMVMLGSMFVIPLLNLGSSEKASLNLVIDYSEMQKDNARSQDKGCTVLTKTVSVSRQVQTPVMVYYVIDGMYQNYRTYNYNMSQRQLSGLWDHIEDCNNFDTVEVDDNTPGAPAGKKKKLALYACGQVSGAWFNDSIQVEMDGEVDVDRLDRDAAVNVEDVAFVRDFRQNKDNSKDPGHYEVPGFKDNTSFKVERVNRPGAKQTVDLADISSSEFLNWLKSSVTRYVYRLYGAIHCMQSVNGNDKENAELLIIVEDRFDAKSFGAEKKIVLRSGTELVRGRLFLNIVHFVVGVITLIVMTSMPCFESYLKKRKGRRGRIYKE